MTDKRQDFNTRYVWGKLVRCTHWLVASAVVFNFFSETGWVHRYVGYFAAILVLLRLLYGLPLFSRWLKPNTTALFYVPKLKDIAHHVSGILSGSGFQGDGHNPLGQLAAYLMWLLILLLAMTGFLAGTDAFFGEDWPVTFHIGVSYALQAVVLIHLFGVMLMSYLQKQNLLISMITGCKSDSEINQ